MQEFLVSLKENFETVQGNFWKLLRKFCRNVRKNIFEKTAGISDNFRGNFCRNFWNIKANLVEIYEKIVLTTLQEFLKCFKEI